MSTGGEAQAVLRPASGLPEFGLEGRVALVTGGGRGIGAAIAQVMARAGARVLIANRTADAGAAVAAGIQAQGGQAQAIGCDIGQPAEARRAVAETVARYGALDIVVHNAAVNPWSSLEQLSEADLAHTLAVNLQACFWLTQAALPHLRRQGGGRILVTSSVTGPRVAMPGAAHYAASKAGVNGFIRAAALELAPEHITVNGVEPGYIAKQGGSLLSNPERARRIAAHIPAGELGRPEDIAYAMCYLASPAARYVTGQTLVVDGGSTLPESPFFSESTPA
ncbi:MAG: SDR family oxidoreductase [Curvibacter lanceolatus]|uniref:SDR family oxidoreductase n=1 Tax=Curvibacter lanceolatus TaxID=86182 RepID=UPI00035DC42F|nr:SDR family oxidoreductase [Curvibacter lanceolatus]MBV5294893.1 SDR family oxidoreductase [Curvibacter lanceolatus]